jgi:hypothetical protein
MANVTLNCPNCGAPVEYDGSDIPALKCSFCGTTISIPAEMRPAKPARVIEYVPSSAYQSVYPVKGRGRPATLIVVVVVLFVIVMVGVTALVPIFITTSALSVVNSQVESVTTQIVGAVTQAPRQPTAHPTATTAPSATPGYEVPGITFGQKGINPGQFSNSRFIATDGTSTIYVADDNGGRVQAFDMNGKYLYQWKVGTAKTIIEGLAADRSGGVYVAFDADILHVNGKTGEILGKLSSPRGGEFGSLVVSPEGNLAAVWYEGRWGIITGLEGHSEDIVFFSPAGKILKTFSSPISSQTDEPSLDIFIAIDGKGNLFALNQDEIFVFSADGKYINKFGSMGSDPGQFQNPNAICTDSQGQLIVGDSRIIQIFSPRGQFVASFAIQGTANGLAYDDAGNLWVLAMDQVTQYNKPGK